MDALEHKFPMYYRVPFGTGHLDVFLTDEDDWLRLEVMMLTSGNPHIFKQCLESSGMLDRKPGV